MKIISFAYTTPAVIAFEKNVTRRDWQLRTALAYNKGDIVQAWDTSPRFGGKKFGLIQLTEKPYEEQTCNAPIQDRKGEGFEFLHKHGILIAGKYDALDLWKAWMMMKDVTKWVVRFEVVDLDRYVCDEIMEKFNLKGVVRT
ncbi:MAG: hypothetical protein AB1600_11420 [Bacteroidota bacterium]